VLELGTVELGAPVRVSCDLYGSLALTGRGHATDTAVILGLAGWEPERLDPDAAPARIADIRARQQLPLAATYAIAFAESDMVFHPRTFLPERPNGMTFTTTLADGMICTETYFRLEAARSSARACPWPRLVAKTRPTQREVMGRTFLLTAAAIGMLYKKRASISAAEMGCQSEVGVACSMAAGALAAVLGSSNAQIENAAEIGMEHNFGLTCDPIRGLVRIPCIERNTMGPVKAINAACLALRSDGSHVVSLDAVIETMRQTGEDMRSQYKETSLGGLAVNVVEC
jgi:L-serine deaminase